MGNKSAASVLDRLHKIFGVKNDNQLGDSLKVKRSTLGNWRARDSVPYTVCVDVADEHDVSLDWLLTGIGSMWRNSEKNSISDEKGEGLLSGNNAQERAVLELFRSLGEADQRVLIDSIQDKQRLTVIENKLEELAVAVAALNRSS